MREFIYRRFAVFHAIIVLSLLIIMLGTIGWIFPVFCDKIFKKFLGI